jgi:hypothetical protein
VLARAKPSLAPHPSSQPRWVRLLGPIGLIALTSAGIVFFSTRGLSGDEAALAPVSVLYLLLAQGLPVLAYVLAAIGLGRPVVALLAPGSVSRLHTQIPLGLGAMLTLSHALGVLGLLSGDGPLPRIVAWGVVALGLLLLLDQIVRGPLRPERWPVLPPASLVLAIPLALLIVAACNPPGALWASEYGAFDALSYHLQLPKEWLAGDRLWPSQHNVYSFLPSYVGAAFTHLGQMSVAPGATDVVGRALGGEGAWVIGCQLLHGATLVLGALTLARAAWVMLVQSGVASGPATTLGLIVAGFVLSTPWALVVGSLAYTEAAMLALGAGAVLLAVDTSIPPVRRAIGVAVCVGLACGCKPTALFMLGPVAGLLMLACAPRADWPRMLAVGVVAGVLSLAPWMARNALASGNPVFPFAAGVLGAGHWTGEQLSRYALNHGPDPAVSIPGRFARLFTPEFGLAHPQWAFVPFLALLGVVAVALAPRVRRAVCVLLAALVLQWAAWAMLTHGQSRFLIPMLVPLALLGALGLGALTVDRTSLPSAAGGPGRVLRVRLALVGGAILVVCLSALAAVMFMREDTGRPNRLLVGGVGSLTGMASDDALQAATDQARAEFLAALPTPEAYINLAIRPQDIEGRGVYLLGDSTPAYILGAIGRQPRPGEPRSPVVYHVTWDASPLGRAMERSPDTPAAWSKSLRDDLGCRYVLVNFDELDRLIRRWRYYDPRVTPERITRWLTDPASGLMLERAWWREGPGTGRALYVLR